MKNRMSGVQLGSCCMGEKVIEGESYEKLTILGNLQASNTQIMNLNVMGKGVLNNCEIGSMSVAGEVTCTEGHIDFMEIAGEVRCIGEVRCGGIHLLGELKNEHTVCHILKYGAFRKKIKYGKKPQIKGTFHADTLENYFPLEISDHQTFQDIINCGQLVCKNTIECAHFFNFESLSAQEINADFAYVYPCSRVSIKEFHGALLIVDPVFDSAWLNDVAYDVEISELYNRSTCKKINIDIIEADEVVLDYVKCKSISAQKIVLGPHCEVDYVEYTDSCKIHEQAKVKECKQL